jgi:molybdopterin-guanine dinucleotide biosynthesis protein A
VLKDVWEMSEGLSALILAGGRSRRMGQDKVWMLLDGMPLVERVVRRVLPLAGELLFAASTGGRFEELARSLEVPARVVADLYPEAGPLAGLHAGLSAARNDLLLALAGDMPFVNLALVQQMIALAPGFDAVVPEVPNRRTGEVFKEPLHALYRRTCLPAISARLAAGERQAISFLADVRVRIVSADEVRRLDPDYRSFFNVNTLEDWQEAQQMMR